MIALCQALEDAHSGTRWASSDPDPLYLKQSNYSRKMREAIMFSSCGSHAANKIDIPDQRVVDPRSRNKSRTYVKKYIDGWTYQGTPSMWRNRKWRKHFEQPPQ